MTSNKCLSHKGLTKPGNLSATMQSAYSHLPPFVYAAGFVIGLVCLNSEPNGEAISTFKVAEDEHISHYRARGLLKITGSVYIR
jgi:hypothetical protein